MFKLFTINKNNQSVEIYPVNGIYIVYELLEYTFEYVGIITEKTIFIEDEVFDYDNRLLIFTDRSIFIKEKIRMFEDYFGYLQLNINGQDFNFEVRIQKLKVPELEEILLFLWNQDPIIFDNFFSKSTVKSRLDKQKENLDFSSKFVNIFEDYYNFFKNNFFAFQSLPHNLLRKQNVIEDYDSAEISSDSVDWLVNNLDEIQIDYAYKNMENSFKLNSNYGLVDKILTVQNIKDFNIYENRIILGSFDYVNLEIEKIKNKIRSVLSATHSYDKDFYSINEFKVIPFLKLQDDLHKIETKINFLQNKYINVFKNAKSINSFPKLTPVFSNKRHYSDAYNKIKLIRDIKINLDGELNLLNVKKLSTLYERFNLFILINAVKSRNPITSKFINAKIEDNTFQEYYFQFKNIKLSLFYDIYVGNISNNIGLQRISKSIDIKSSRYYKPDYIIKTEKDDSVVFYILDSKYSSENTVKNNHMPLCIKKYILDIGITDSSAEKVAELILLYPGDNETIIYGSDVFKPKISIMPSKVHHKNLALFVDRILLDSL